MWELDYKESWALKNWCFWTVVLEKTLGSPLDTKEIKQVNPKGNKSWIFTGRTDAKAETPILWPPDGKNWLGWKDPDAEKDWRQEKGMTEDEMVGWHHWLNGHEFEQAPGDGEGQGSLACCSPWDQSQQQQNVSIHSPPHPPPTSISIPGKYPSVLIIHQPSTHHHWLSNSFPSVFNNCLSIHGWFTPSPRIWFSVTNLRLLSICLNLFTTHPLASSRSVTVCCCLLTNLVWLFSTLWTIAC